MAASDRREPRDRPQVREVVIAVYGAIRERGVQPWCTGRSRHFTPKSHINFCLLDSTREATKALQRSQPGGGEPARQPAGFPVSRGQEEIRALGQGRIWSRIGVLCEAAQRRGRWGVMAMCKAAAEATRSAPCRGGYGSI